MTFAIGFFCGVLLVGIIWLGRWANNDYDEWLKRNKDT